jgi:hypothetical protein
MQQGRAMMDEAIFEETECAQPRTVDAAELRVGDTIEVWWQPGRDTITKLRPYTGPLECLKGGWIAEFAILRTGMTIEPGSQYRKI